MTVKPYFQDNDVVIYHGDCRDILPTLEPVDLVLTDPPYGIGLDTDYNKGKFAWGTTHEAVTGDNKDFDPVFLLGYKRLIIWGGNCFASRLPDSKVWLAWDKVIQNGLHLRIAEMELAWTNCIHRPQIFRHMWSGAYRDSERGAKYHPTQKPVALMGWCLGLVPDAQTILDPFMGSGTTLRAAKDLGRKAIGIEIEERYCEIAARRMSQSVMVLA